ncbi:MAG: hypothetical protein AUH69_00445 [Actinobacteria bacterium 13_1_40CM_4_65_12]|nr:MAG: hypothetical protein AUH69_00445 [Actinobacteria bacterium 13_1_40CM_4_65_12]
MRLHWKAALCFMLQDPEWKTKIFVGGLWLLAFPPLGWPIALGYRKETLCGLVEGRTPLLPPWRGQWPIFLREGLKAGGIILIYFVPFLLGFLSMAIDDWSGVRDHAVELVAFGVAILLLLPICLPLIPPLYWYLFDWIELSGVEMVVIGLLFWGTTFIMPAAFLQVSLRGRFAAALRVDRVVMFVGRNLPTYLEAWAISVIATAAALASGPAAPWGIFWSYLVIIYAFNEALFRSNTPEVRRRFRTGAWQNPPSTSG